MAQTAREIAKAGKPGGPGFDPGRCDSELHPTVGLTPSRPLRAKAPQIFCRTGAGPHLTPRRGRSLPPPRRRCFPECFKAGISALSVPWSLSAFW